MRRLERLAYLRGSNLEKSASEDPKVDAAVESQVSKSARPGAPGRLSAASTPAPSGAEAQIKMDAYRSGEPLRHPKAEFSAQVRIRALSKHLPWGHSIRVVYSLILLRCM
jgi:hypothetical protein